MGWLIAFTFKNKVLTLKPKWPTHRTKQSQPKQEEYSFQKWAYKLGLPTIIFVPKLFVWHLTRFNEETFTEIK